jgi:hypothetical protein
MKIETSPLHDLVVMQQQYQEAWDAKQEAEARFKCARIACKTTILLMLSKYKISSWLLCIPGPAGAGAGTDEGTTASPFHDLAGARREYRLAWLALQEQKARCECAEARRTCAFSMSPVTIYTIRSLRIGVSAHYLTSEGRQMASDRIYNACKNREKVKVALHLRIYEGTFKDSMIDPELMTDLQTQEAPLNEAALRQIIKKAEELNTEM